MLVPLFVNRVGHSVYLESLVRFLRFVKSSVYKKQHLIILFQKTKPTRLVFLFFCFFGSNKKAEPVATAPTRADR